MSSKLSIYRAGKLIIETNSVQGETLLERLGAEGLFLDAPCGGQGKCGKCLVKLSPGGEEVLACRTHIEGDMSVYLPEAMDMKIADGGGSESGADGAAAAAKGKNGGAAKAKASAGSGSSKTADARRGARKSAAAGKLGVAVDIGTTTVVAHLTDMNTGERLATASGVNAQRLYGSDVISRIQYCAENGHDVLTRLIREQLSGLISEACEAAGAKIGKVRHIAIAANTIMEHLAAGYSPVGMGVVPFTTVSLFGEELAAEGVPGVAEDAKIYYAPAISSYVGGDITAGMLAAGLEGMTEPTVYLDIGTNGEIAFKLGDKYYCCATAAGPAFEGAEISMGMAAVSGAINHVKWDGGLMASVIGAAGARGLCGSGLLDALSVLLETGAVDESGRLLGADEIEHDISKHIGVVDGANAFFPAPGSDVHMTASDIRKLQLAKSAIAAGIQTLLHHVGVAEADVKHFILAGGFGSFMDKHSAARIGLFPGSFLPVAQTLGNTAGEGAALMLSSHAARVTLSDIRERCEYIELSSSPVFNEQFVEQMTFEADHL